MFLLTLGFVTTARLTHATPGALYAHTNDRDWECDSKFDQAGSPPEGAHDIAWQFVNSAPGNRTKVAMGGGYTAFYPKSMKDELLANSPTSDLQDWDCFREDEVNLAEQWVEQHENGKLVRSL